MNNPERIIWLSTLILGGFFCNNKISQINRLELLNEHHELSRSIQSDQITELRHKFTSNQEIHYQKGFEDGRSHAMLAALHGEHFYDYADGYHAALSQFKDLNDEELNKQVTRYLDRIMQNAKTQTEIK